MRQNVWFNLTDDMLDLKVGTVTIPAALAKRRREHRIYLTRLEVELLREQLMARRDGNERWCSRRRRAQVEGEPVPRSGVASAVEAAGKARSGSRREAASQSFEGFTFHMLRHTAASLMALAGMDPAAAAERLEHSDGGALFHKTYRHLYEGEKRNQAKRLEALVVAELDKEGTGDGEETRGGAQPSR